MINEHNPVADTSDGYHTYVMEWEDNAIRWYFDGVKVFEIGDNGTYKWGSAAPNAIAGAPVYPKPFTADNPMKLRINFAVGGQGAGAPDGTTPSTGIVRHRLRQGLLALSSLRTSANGRVPHGEPGRFATCRARALRCRGRVAAGT